MAESFRRPLVLAATAFAALVCVVVVLVRNAPANWLARAIAAESGGTVLLADAEGTIWSGSAVLAVAATAGSSAPTTADATPAATKLALPGRIAWRLELQGFTPVLHLADDGVLTQPLELRRAGAGLSAGAGAATLPAAILALAGPPLNTLKPDGRCELRWGPLTIDSAGRVAGEGTIRAVGLALGLSPLRPLGTYVVNWTSGANGLVWQLATESGPLVAAGNGTVRDRDQSVRMTFRASADASPSARAQLGPLLDMIGRRGRDEAVFEESTTGRS